MSTPDVHWYQGMFLRPHHFHIAQRHASEVAHRNETFDHGHYWGIHAIDLDLDALANNRFVVRSLKARFRDGTTAVIPEDGVLPAIDLKDAFGRNNELMVFLALPVLNPSQANVADSTSADGVRYRLASQNLVDENTGDNPQPIKVRLLHLRLLLSGDDNTGFEMLPLARITRSQRAEATPQLDLTYIPPILAANAWTPLWFGILQAIYDRIGKKSELLASQVVTRNITFDSHGQGDQLIFNQLRDLNEAYSHLGIMVFTEGVHPLAFYLELARLLGKLAIYGSTRRPPRLPRYDHDDLGTCFYQAKQLLDAQLDILVEPEYKERAFIGAGLRMQVSLEPAWLESGWEMFIGVQSALDAEECIRLLTKPGQLDMKIGGSERVDTIFRMGMAGLKFDHSPRPPRSLPSAPGLIYFQVSHDAAQSEWMNVQRSLTLAIRLNENLIAGNIQGQRILMIRTPNISTTLQFTLYVVPARPVT
jgi:type VI secretion system protein ImpJ